MPDLRVQQQATDHLVDANVVVIINYVAPNMETRTRRGLEYMDDERLRRTWRTEYAMGKRAPTTPEEVPAFVTELARRVARSLLTEKPLLTMDGGKAAERRRDLAAQRQQTIRARMEG